MTLPDVASLRALLLDLDDTILDDHGGVQGAWDAVVEFIGVPDPDALRRAIAEVTDWFWSDPERERRGRLDLLQARYELMSGALAKLDRSDDALARAAARHYTQYREASYRMADGAGDALERLRARFPAMALVTNGAALPQRAKIERFGLARYFEHIQVEGEFGLGKPEPRVFEHVTRVLEVEPSQCLFVGDNYRADVVGPLGVGMHAAWIDVRRRGSPPLDPPRPHATVGSLVELADRLGC